MKLQSAKTRIKTKTVIGVFANYEEVSDFVIEVEKKYTDWVCLSTVITEVGEFGELLYVTVNYASTQDCLHLVLSQKTQTELVSLCKTFRAETKMNGMKKIQTTKEDILEMYQNGTLSEPFIFNNLASLFVSVQDRKKVFKKYGIPFYKEIPGFVTADKETLVNRIINFSELTYKEERIIAWESSNYF